MERTAQRPVFRDEPLVIVLTVLAVILLQVVCDCVERVVSERGGEFLVIHPSFERVPNFVRFGDELDLNAEEKVVRV